ncbi:MAG: 4Fe-4S binding protein [Spirochaetaceae bacterium]|jgi:RnfABCDGE-type electron transport complex B subunit|nr:4Fe-4S binding protein [Spirochaetaceae bacterium]
MTVLYTFILSAVLALILGFLLGIFKKIFFVPVDEAVAKVRAVLPGANCGACGYAGCDSYAAAVAAGNAPTNACAAGGASVAAAVADAVGKEGGAVEKKAALLACQGGLEFAQAKAEYCGVKSCQGAKIAVNGVKLCPYGCIGFGDCVAVCAFGALSMGSDGLPRIDYAKCVGCGACQRACPQGLFALVSESQKGVIALCSNRTTNRPTVLKSCKKGCIKCSKCVTSCPEKAIELVNGIPKVDYTKCTSCGTCIAGCPTKVLAFISDIEKTA